MTTTARRTTVLGMAEQVQIGISRIYLKDLSFESPLAPEVFRTQFQPEIKIDVSVRHERVDNNLYEVTLEITATGMQGDKKVLVVEVEQAGLFMVQGLAGDQLEHALRVFCPSILFPYARTVVDGAMNQGTLPSLMLPPFNFESLLRRGNVN